MTIGDQSPHQELHRADILFFRMLNPDWISRQIVSAQKNEGFSDFFAQWSHVGMLMIPKHLIVAEMIPPIGQMHPLLDRYNNYEIMVMRHHWQNGEERFKFLLDMAYYTNVPYSFLGVLKFRLPFLFAVERANFCSEVVEMCAKKNPELRPDGFVKGYEPTKVSPARLLHDGYVTKVVKSGLPPDRLLNVVGLYKIFDGVWSNVAGFPMMEAQ